MDAGHGGHDPGCNFKGKKEKDVTLAIATKFAKLVKDSYPSIKVILTRDEDEFVELHERANIANRNKADLFISIHVNSNPVTKFNGTETYCMGNHKTQENLAVAKRENSVVLLEDNYSKKYNGFDPKLPETNIIFSMFQDVNLKQSIRFASNVEKKFKSSTSRKSLGVKQAGFLVLWKTTMPSVLIETGFLSNPKERTFLTGNKGQSEMANAIFLAFKEYKQDLEN